MRLSLSLVDTLPWISFDTQIDRYMLTILGMNGTYRIYVEGRPIGTATGEQLRKGVNLAFMIPEAWGTGGPWA